MKEIKQLKLNFPNGASTKECNAIALLAQDVVDSRISSGGFQIEKFPFTQEDEKEYGMQFSQDIMSFYFDYEKKDFRKDKHYFNIREYCDEKAAQAWCTDETKNIEMNPLLAKAFADILFKQLVN